VRHRHALPLKKYLAGSPSSLSRSTNGPGGSPGVRRPRGAHHGVS
jgi:hypothetical protein